MIHAFLLIVTLGNATVSQDMYFRSIDRCNYFASRVVKRYGNFQYSYLVPEEHRAMAYCKPVYIDATKTRVYE
jgi:hypothetical protein